MANMRTSEVGYRPLRLKPVLADGLLQVDRPDGGPERRVAEAFARVAYQADQVADELAQAEGRAAGLRDALASGPRPSEISGGVTTTVEGGAPSPMNYAVGGGGGAVTGNRVATGGGDLDARGRYIYEGLRKRGFSHIMAAASVGHGRQESSLHSDGPDGDKGTSSGVWQWRNERRTALQGFARLAGKNWRDVDTQMDFYVHELKTSPSERLAWNRLQGATDIVGATEALMHFERPQHYTARTPRRGHGWDNRLANARWAMAFGSDDAPAATVPDAPAAAALAPAPAASGAAAAIDAIAPREAGVPPATTPVAPAAGSPTPVRPQDVGPPTVTRSVDPAEIRRQGGGFRPTGSMTLRGRAYDAAGMRTYLEQLDNTIRADADEVYRRFKDDPAALDGAFQALRTVHMDDHVFPEVAANYDSTFGTVTRAYSRQARDDQERRVLAQDRASFLERSAEMETMTARAVESFDPTNADAEAAIASAQGASDAHFDSAVARGLMDPDDAVRAKVASRRNTAVAFYTRQAAVQKTPEDVAALKERMRVDFAAGGLDGLDGEGWAVLEAAIDRTATEKRVQAAEASRTLKARGDALADAVVNGFEVDSGEMGRFLLDRNTTSEGPAIVDQAMEKIGAARILRDKPLKEAGDYVLQLERDPRAVANGTADYARAELGRMQAAADKDPIGLAERKGMLPGGEPSLAQGGGPADVAARVTQRVLRAESAAGQFGVTAKYLRPGEADQIRALVEQDPDAAAALAAGIVQGAGPRAGLVLAELGDDAPAVTQAGVILGGGGSARAASDVIAGHGVGPDGKKLPEVLKEPQRRQIAGDLFGGAFAGSPRSGGRTIAAAEAIARVRVARAGIDPSSEAAVPIFERALQEAAGAVFEGDVQFGGLTRLSVEDGWFGTSVGSSRPTVAVPPTIRADRFGDVIEAIRDADLVPADDERSRVGRRAFRAAPVRENGKPYTAADLKAAKPVAVAGGYSFSLGDPASDDPRWIRGADGQPFVLSIDLMRPVLEARVPGAFR